MNLYNCRFITCFVALLTFANVFAEELYVSQRNGNHKSPVNDIIAQYRKSLDWTSVSNDVLIKVLTDLSVKQFRRATGIDLYVASIVETSMIKLGMYVYNLTFVAEVYQGSSQVNYPDYLCNSLVVHNQVTTTDMKVYCYDIEWDKKLQRNKPLKNAFHKYLHKYDKNYLMDAEYKYRLQVIVDNLQEIKELNEDSESAHYSLTKFSDLTQHEFKLIYTGATVDVDSDLPPADAEIPDVKDLHGVSIDWRKEKAVNPVKDQGHCGSCWAFSVIGNLESQWFRKTGDLHVLSEQELIDCDEYDNGCYGGYPDKAHKYLSETGPVALASDYPYVQKKQRCHSDEAVKSPAHMKGSVTLPQNEEDIAKWVLANGPVSIVLNAANMQHYSGGIARPTKEWCDPRDINHAVVIVGFGETHLGEKVIPYWIVRNSWGADWGEDGYWRVYRGSGACGLNYHVTSVVV